MSLILETDSGTGANITSELAIGEYTASGPVMLAAQVTLSSLNSGAANLTYKMRSKASDGTKTGTPHSEVVAKDTVTLGTVAKRIIGPLLLASGEKAEVRLLSSNGSDTAVSWAVDWIDLAQVNVEKISGTAQTARDIGASVLLSSGTGTGQVSLSSGLVKATDGSGNALATAAALAVVQNAIGRLVGSYTGLETPPHPKSLAFRAWKQARINNRVAQCDIERAITYYFDFANGNDTTGDGSQETPWKTATKAQAIRNATLGSLELSFRRGTTDDSGGGLDDIGLPTTFSSWATAADYMTDKPTFDGGGADLTGIKISCHTSCAKDLRCTNWSGDFNYPFMFQQEGTDVGLFLRCVGDIGKSHIFGSYHGGTGGIHACVECTAKTLSADGGTFYNGYAFGGGNEFIVSNCQVTLDEHAQTGVYGHTNGGSAKIGMVICDGLVVTSNSTSPNGQPFNISDIPVVSSAAESRIWDIGTVQQPFVGSIPALAPPAGAVRINPTYNCILAEAGPRGATGSGWCYNLVLRIDCAALTTNFAKLVLYHTSETGAVTWTVENAHIEWFNTSSLSRIGFSQTEFNDGEGNTTLSTGSTLENSIISVDAPCIIGESALRFANSNGNAWFGIRVDEESPQGAYATDANKIILPSRPVAFADPSPTSPIYGEAQAPSDGVFLEYDHNWNPRNPSAPNIGPIESGSVIESVSAMLSQLDDGTQNVQSRLPAALIDGRMNSNTQAMSEENITDIAEGIAGEIGVAPTTDEIWSNGQRTLTGGPLIAVDAQQHGSYRLVRGNEYSATARSFLVTKHDGAEWPTDLDDYAWVYAATRDADNAETGSDSIAGSVAVVTPTGASQAVRVSITAAVTGGAAKGLYLHSIRGIATGGIGPWTIDLGETVFVDDPAEEEAE